MCLWKYYCFVLSGLTSISENITTIYSPFKGFVHCIYKTITTNLFIVFMKILSQNVRPFKGVVRCPYENITITCSPFFWFCSLYLRKYDYKMFVLLRGLLIVFMKIYLQNTWSCKGFVLVLMKILLQNIRPFKDLVHWIYEIFTLLMFVLLFVHCIYENITSKYSPLQFFFFLYF